MKQLQTALLWMCLPIGLFGQQVSDAKICVNGRITNTHNEPLPQTTSNDI